MRVARLMLRPLARTIDWTPLAVSALLTVPLALFAGAGADPGPALYYAVVLLRLSAILIGAAAGFVLVDPLAAGTGPVPVPRWLRQGVRALLGVAAGTLIWACVFTVVRSRLPGVPLPLAGLAAEAGVCLALALACTASTLRRYPDRPAALVGAVVLSGVLAATLFLRGDASPWIMPGEPGWEEVHRVWLAVSPLPVIWLAVANRDLR
ncbi:hypothetical protein ABGB17_11060 [Sphaerisporangium sp. B11E5]|uniref:hypothetical protein n=1 Tax=Sphaerisporangium sp. B11E5 TaxID=3153563 RepID=UPI00325D0BF2